MQLYFPWHRTQDISELWLMEEHSIKETVRANWSSPKWWPQRRGCESSAPSEPEHHHGNLPVPQAPEYPKDLQCDHTCKNKVRLYLNHTADLYLSKHFVSLSWSLKVIMRSKEMIKRWGLCLGFNWCLPVEHRNWKLSLRRSRRQKRNQNFPNRSEILPWMAANFSMTVVGWKFLCQQLLMLSTTPGNHFWNGLVTHLSFSPQHNRCLILSLTMFLLPSHPVTLLFSWWVLPCFSISVTAHEDYNTHVWQNQELEVKTCYDYSRDCQEVLWAFGIRQPTTENPWICALGTETWWAGLLRSSNPTIIKVGLKPSRLPGICCWPPWFDCEFTNRFAIGSRKISSVTILDFNNQTVHQIHHELSPPSKPSVWQPHQKVFML